jgi:hypothetical protein
MLADQPRIQEAYRLAESAYQEIDQVNHLVEERASYESGGKPDAPIGLIIVLPSDGLKNVLAELDQAITSLDSMLRES